MTPAPVPVVNNIEVMEELENALCLHHGSIVVAVRPSFGTQSDSWSGQLTAHTDKFPIQFQVISAGQATIFQVGDVAKLETPDAGDRQGELVIYLKGPKDY